MQRMSFGDGLNLSQRSGLKSKMNRPAEVSSEKDFSSVATCSPSKQQ